MIRRTLIAGCLLAGAASFMTACDRIEDWLPQTRCVLSGRPIHSGMGARIEVDGGGPSGDVCCLACVITYARQTGEAVRVLWVTDYISNERIRPRSAVYVVGSKVRRCAGPLVDVPAGRRKARIQSWDRCLPAVTAFANRESAECFRREAGGTILTFSALVEGTRVTAAQ